MEEIQITKSQIVNVERPFGRGERQVIVTQNGKYDILKEGEVFVTKIDDVYIAYKILENGLVEQLDKFFTLK